MSKWVLDSSVLIAVFRNERVEADTLRILEGSVMSTVNLAEVWTKLHDLGLAQDALLNAVLAMLDRPEPFTSSQANLAAGHTSPRPLTRRPRLSRARS